MCVYRLIFIAVVAIVDDETVQNERKKKNAEKKTQWERQSERYLSIYGKSQSRVSWKFSSKTEKYKKIIIIIVWSHVDTFLWPRVWVCVCVGGRYFSLIWNRTNDHSRCRWWLWDGAATWGTCSQVKSLSPSPHYDGGVSAAPQIKSSDNKSPLASSLCVICRTWPGHGLDKISVDLCDIFQTCNFWFSFSFWLPTL